jgi:hypothetical protein
MLLLDNRLDMLALLLDLLALPLWYLAHCPYLNSSVIARTTTIVVTTPAIKAWMISA